MSLGRAFKPGRKALIPYLTVGYPSIETTLEVVPALEASGADIVELGIPFSDPLADGTTIQEASHLSLEAGTTPRACLDTARRLRERGVRLPLVFMTYYNPVFHYGLDAFCAACAEAGVDGLIVPDLPPDEGAGLELATQGHGLDLVYLLAPTSPPDRIRLVAEHSRGFIYLVSLTGVTGARASLPADLEAFVRRVRQATDLPLCVGFGISTAEAARRVAAVADGVIVGSRLLQMIKGARDPAASASAFIAELRQALDGPGPHVILKERSD
ncbi:MAG: tryptophan synthase subunit alpha [Chloroflexi bacterium]|nr:tryptophan synthase subunit alpha [Chloroflexota bacterium]